MGNIRGINVGILHANKRKRSRPIRIYFNPQSQIHRTQDVIHTYVYSKLICYRMHIEYIGMYVEINKRLSCNKHTHKSCYVYEIPPCCECMWVYLGSEPGDSIAAAAMAANVIEVTPITSLNTPSTPDWCPGLVLLASHLHNNIQKFSIKSVLIK